MSWSIGRISGNMNDTDIQAINGALEALEHILNRFDVVPPLQRDDFIISMLPTASPLGTIYAPLGVEVVTDQTQGTPPTGLASIDSLSFYEGERVLLTGYTGTNEIYNGLWVAHSGKWTRPSDFATATTVGNGTDVVASYNADGTNLLTWTLNANQTLPFGSTSGAPSAVVVDTDKQVWTAESVVLTLVTNVCPFFS